MTKLAVSFWIVLSLFVSSVSACTCAHNSVQAENHCQPNSTQNLSESKNESHSHSHEALSHESNTEHQPATSTEDFSDSFSLAECCCLQSAPRVFAKSETVKLEKQTAKVLLNPAIDFQSNAAVVEAATFDFVTSVYFSNSFRNPKSPRAPPHS